MGQRHVFLQTRTVFMYQECCYPVSNSPEQYLYHFWNQHIDTSHIPALVMNLAATKITGNRSGVFYIINRSSGSIKMPASSSISSERTVKADGSKKAIALPTA